ncbi:leucine-rich repeat domain-containing protein [Planctomycetota bacterium]
MKKCQARLNSPIVPMASLSRPQTGIPRQFSTGAILIFASLYALLIRLLLWINIEPIVIIGLAVFLTGVGIAQACLFGGHKPRQASVLAGFFLGPVSLLAYFISSPMFMDIFNRFRWPNLIAGFVYPVIVYGQAFGMLLGYLLGLFAAAAFVFPKKFRRSTLPSPIADKADENEDVGNRWDNWLLRMLSTVAQMPSTPGQPRIQAAGVAFILAYLLVPFLTFAHVAGAPASFVRTTSAIGFSIIVVCSATWAGTRLVGAKKSMSIAAISSLASVATGWFATDIAFHPSYGNFIFVWWIRGITLFSVMVIAFAITTLVTSLIAGIGSCFRLRTRDPVESKTTGHRRYLVCLYVVLFAMHLAVGICLFVVSRQPYHVVSREVFQLGGRTFRDRVSFDGRFTDEDAAVLGRLSDLPQLDYCDLSHTQISDAALDQLSIQKLMCLNLSNTQVAGTNFHVFRERSSTLAHLVLVRTNVDDDGIANLKGLAFLRSLDLAGCNVTDQAIPDLARFNKLGRLNLRNTNVTKAGVQELQQKLPGCQIEWFPHPED